MKQLATAILNLRSNLVGTIAVAILSSLTTTLAIGYFGGGHSLQAGSSSITSPSPIASGPSVLDCENGVYSPVQKKCVSQDIFDAEMKRLFAALGIDTSIYQSGSKASE